MYRFVTEPQTDRSERIARATKWMEEQYDKPAGELSAMMTGCRDRFIAELDGLTDPQVVFSPGESEWSVKEVCLHVSNALTATAGGIAALARGTTIPGKGQDDIGVMDADPGNSDDIRTNVEGAFEKAIKAVGILEHDCDMDATYTHPFFGPLNCRQMAVFNILHMNVHVAQLKRIKGTEGFPA